MMRRSCQTVLLASLVVCAWLMFQVVPVRAAGLDGSDTAPEGQDAEELTERPAEPQEAGEPAERPAEPQRYVTAQTGYRFISPDAVTAAAAPYSRLRSGMAGGFSAGTLGSDLKLSGEGFALNEDDYHANLFLDYSGYFRLHLESEALWHNLLREQLPASSPGLYAKKQSDPADGFGIRISNSQVENRIKLGNNPIHINLGYWELRREGTEQLRFSDHYFADPQNAIIAAGRSVNQVTREGKVGFDAHLQYIDVAYTFLIRDFSNDAADYRYTFAVNANAALKTGSPQATNAISDSRVTSHTIKLYSDMSGGLVGTAVYSLTQRENSVNHGDARPSSQPVDTLQSVAGDLSYTPFKELSFALKYRRLQIDRDSPATVFYPYATAGTLLVRPSVDTVKDTLSLSGTYRPSQQFTYRLEYRAVLESRGNVVGMQAAPSDLSAIHSENRQTHTGTVYASWKPCLGLKVNATYSYSSTVNPDYGASSSDSHKGELFVTYAKNGTWGATASFITRYETSQSSASTILDPAIIFNPAANTVFRLPREYRNNSAHASFWFSPLERLTVTTSYSFLQTDTDQSVLIANVSPGALAASNYRSTAHLFGIDAVYALTDLLDLSLGFQQVRSDSRFNLSAASFRDTTNVIDYSTAGIADLTRLDSTETGVTARADWRMSKHVGCSLDYGFRNYNSGNPLFDGSVHTTLLSLTTRW